MPAPNRSIPEVRRLAASGMVKLGAFRVLRAVFLASHPGGGRSSAIKAQLGLTIETMYRLVRTMREAGIEVHWHKPERPEARLFIDPQWSRENTQLSVLDWLILAQGRQTARPLAGSALDIQPALEDTATLRPPYDKPHLDADVARMFFIMPEPGALPAEHSDGITAKLVDTLLEKVAISVTLTDGVGERTHVMQPLALVVYRQVSFVLARFDTGPARDKQGVAVAVPLDHDEVFSFRVGDIVRMRKLKAPRVYPPDWRPSLVVSRLFGSPAALHAPSAAPQSARPVAITLRFSAAAAPYVASRQWQSTQVMTARPDGSLDLALAAIPSPELLHWIVGFGPAVEVLKPEGLRVIVRAQHRKAGLPPHP